MKHFLDSKQRNKAILVFVASIIIISMAIVLYTRTLNDTVRENTVEEMKEIALLCKDSIQSENKLMWDLSEQLSKRLRAKKYDTPQAICEGLNSESATDYFDIIFLVDDKGVTYSSTHFIENRSGELPVRRILSGDGRFVVKYYEDSASEKYRDSLVYGISFEPLVVGDVTFVGLYAIADMDILEQTMKLNSFGGEGYSVVFDKDGYYIVKKDTSESVARQQNFYTDLSQDYGYTDEMIKELKTKIASKEPFMEDLKNTDKEEILIQFETIKDADWTLILVVPKAVVNQGSQRFVKQTVLMLIIIVAIIAAIMYLVLKTASTVIESKADAKARSEFLATMSHEIRTPLNGIIGLNHLMQAHINDKEKLTEYLKKSADTEKYLLSTINDILDVQILEAGKMDIVKEPFSISGMISAIEVIIRHRMDDKHIYFSIEKEITDDVIIGDQTRIQQILLNILSNAQKFTAENGNVEFVISQTPGADGEVVTTYTVTDDGCGMTKEFQERIFDPFSQERNSLKDSLKGTGLGMNISYMLSHQMGGDLSVDSVLGEGSRFTLVLQTPIAELIYADNKDDERIADAGNTKKALNILVAEDDELNAEIMMEVLEMNGHKGRLAVDGEQVVRFFEESPEYTYDVILMDLQMPKMSGYEATKRIRELDRKDAKDVIIYACTANTMQKDVRMAQSAGMNDFIAKPVDIEKMLEMLKYQKLVENESDKQV